MAVTVTDHNGNPLTLDQAVSGSADTHHPDALASVTTSAYHYARLNGNDARVFWNEQHQQWWWEVAQ